MEVTFKQVVENVSNLRYYRGCCASISEMIESLSLNITSTMDDVGIRGKGSVSRKTENEAMKRIELCARQRRYRETIDFYENAIIRTPLSGDERELIDYINENGGGKLAQYAREKGYGVSQIYKIRDRAIKRIRDYINQ